MCAMEKMLYGENGAYMCYKENEKKKTRKKEITEITVKLQLRKRQQEERDKKMR